MNGETILRGASYSKTEFLRRIGKKQTSWRTLKKAGLRTIQIAGGAFVLGDDWIDFLASQGPQRGTLSDQAASSSVSGTDLSGGRHNAPRPPQQH